MKLFFSVGEPSGDLHGANLINELFRLNSNTVCVGYGGPRMKASGCDVHEDLTKFSLMWFLRVLLHFPTFWNLLQRADVFFRDHRPDAVILIDYPGFNWWVARKAKKYGIPVFYYGTPQMWAWAGWRVKKMKRLVDHALCKLPFEVDWYRQRGCSATYVGHPYFDELSSRQIDQEFVDSQNRRPGELVTILPGSRRQEVDANLASFLKTAARIRARLPMTRFAIASFNELQAETARRFLANGPIDIDVFVGKTPELISAAKCCLACSGSVSLELLYHEKPTVIHYRIGRLPYVIQSFFRKVRFITLVNLLATDDRFCKRGEIYDPIQDKDKVPFPEYLTCDDRAKEMADHICEWMEDSQSHDRVVTQLRQVKTKFMTIGASSRAANYIVEQLESKKCARSSKSVAA